MEEKQEKLRSRLKLFFWLNTIILVLVTGYLMYLKGPYWGEGVEPNVVLERYAIISTLICIPLALKLFHSKVKKIESLAFDAFLSSYFSQYSLRFFILDAVVAFNLAGFYMHGSQNLILMAIIAMCATLFCYPGKGALEYKTLEKEINENINNEEEL